MIGEKVIGRLLCWYDNSGYGFAKVNGLDRDVFIHYQNCSELITKNDVGSAIEFKLQDSKKGYRGVNVVLVRNTL